MTSERSHTKKEKEREYDSIQNSKKCKLLYSDRKQVSSCLEIIAERYRKEGIKQGKRKLWGDRYAHYPHHGDGSQEHSYVRSYQIYTVNMHSLLC